MKPITAFVERHECSKELAQPSGGERQDDQAPIALAAIRDIIIQEFGKIEIEFQKFRADICKTLEVMGKYLS